MCNCAAQAAEIFVERYRAFSSQQHPRIPRNAENRRFLLGTPKTRAGELGDFSKVEKMKRRRGGEEKREGKGRRKEGENLFFYRGSI